MKTADSFEIFKTHNKPEGIFILKWFSIKNLEAEGPFFNGFFLLKIGTRG
jgi:hypothetical protein